MTTIQPNTKARDATEHALPLPLLPPELPWVYAIAPLPAAYVLGQRGVQSTLLAMLLKAYVPFIGFGLLFHVVYRYLMPGWLGATSSRWARLSIHTVFVLISVPLMALVLIPIMDALEGHEDPLQFVVISYIFAVVCLWPAISLQGLRVRARQAERRVLMERRAAVEAQLAALQARMNPHFLFNSLNTIASLIPDDPELAERTLERLSDLLRYALESGQRRTVALERELAMIADYLELQAARFAQRLQTRLSIVHGLGGVEIPPMLLQPLVENAILHGASSEHRGQVEVAVQRERDQLVIEVSDNGPGPGRSLHSGAGTGFASVAERLRLHYGDAAALSLEARPQGGSIARLSLPIAGAP